jgi:DNA-binding PadR family transcriptional regulator
VGQTILAAAAFQVALFVATSREIISLCVIIMPMRVSRDPDPGDLLPLSPQVFHILAALAGGDQHGYGIMQEVASRTAGKLRLSPGTLYGSIKRMLEQGLIAELSDGERPAAGDDERRRYYRLTPFGRKVAKAEAVRLAELLEQARAYGLAPKRS